MSAPWGCGAENGDCTKRDKDRGENSVIHTPGEACAKEREGGEFDKGPRVLSASISQDPQKDGRILAHRPRLGEID
jgi:hypothetical protein